MVERIGSYLGTSFPLFHAPRHLYLICFMCGKDHHLSKIFDLLTMILYVRKYLIAKETLYVPTNILNSQRHVLLLQLTQLK